MQAVVDGKVIELSEAGWLMNLDEWSEDLAVEIAKNENIPAEWPTHLRLLEVWGYLIGPALYLRSHLTVDRTGLLS